MSIDIKNVLVNTFKIVDADTMIKGRKYFEKNAIRKIDSYEWNGYTVFNAKVKGTIFYDTKIAVKAQRNSRDVMVSCSCPLFETYNVTCKHITALYFYILKNIIPNINEVSNEYNLDANFIINLFTKENSNKQKINLEYIFDFNDSQYTDYDATLSLKIGLDKLYMVKSIPNFLKAIESKTTIEYGKNFIFNPELQEFKDEDKPIIDYLMHIFSIDSMNKYYYKSEIFSNKLVFLNRQMLTHILKYFKDKPFNVVFNNNTYTNVVPVFDEIPFKIKFSEIDEKITAKLVKKNITFLTYNHDFILSNNKLYVLDKNSIEYKLYSFLNDRNNVVFNNEYKNKILSLIPKISENQNFQVEQNILDKFKKADLNAKIYIDKFKKGIRLNVIFEYDNHKINPFSKDNKQSEFLIRDYDKESQILNILNNSGFNHQNDFIYLDEDSKMYMFFKNSIPMLQELAEIYYTNAVKDIYKSNLKINTKVSASTFGLINLDINIDGIDKKEIKNILKSIKEKKNYYKLKNGTIISLEDKSIENVSNIIDNIEDTDIDDNVINLEKYRALSLFNKIDKDIEIENRFIIDDILNKIKNAKEQTIEVPQPMDVLLREYQVTGFKWLKTLSNLELGGVLADDMGLGKTIQAIALLYSEKENGKSLIVAPSSLIYNWQNEFNKFVPDMKVIVIQGDKKKREDLLNDINNYDVIITSYPLLKRDIDLYKDVNFNICIIDEAQHIKNPESQNAQSVKSINSRVKFALTGTPMENNLLELWSIFDFILPGLLHSKHKFLQKYDKPITKNQDKEVLEDLKKTIAPFILRRKKADVLLELPEKIETKLICEMTKKQSEIYTSYLIKAKEEVQKLIDEGEFETSKIQILKLLTRLRQICCHPSLFLENYNGDSGKLEQLQELVEELIEGEHKVLIFSQFTSLLEIVKNMLNKMKIKYMYLDGSTEVEKRQQLVNDFNNGDTNIFLLSLKAGGTGLNLTSADTVIHLDPWWNPAVEEQASDRAHRIGQKNVVQVFKLITKDTIEEKIYELQLKKKELIDSVIQEGEVFINTLSEREILDILS